MRRQRSELLVLSLDRLAAPVTRMSFYWLPLAGRLEYSILSLTPVYEWHSARRPEWASQRLQSIKIKQKRMLYQKLHWCLNQFYCSHKIIHRPKSVRSKLPTLGRNFSIWIHWARVPVAHRCNTNGCFLKCSSWCVIEWHICFIHHLGLGFIVLLCLLQTKMSVN